MDKFVTREKRRDPTPPPAKRSRQEAQKDYDANKRERSVQQSWFKDFPWLMSDGDTLYCTTCRSVYGPLVIKKLPEMYHKRANGAFVKGSKSIRRDGLTDHNTSKNHEYADRINKARQNPKNTEANRSLQMMYGKDLPRLEKMFINAHAIVKNNRPITDFLWHCTADEKKGLDMGNTYRNDTSCKEFIVAEAEVTQEIIQNLRKLNS